MGMLVPVDPLVLARFETYHRTRDRALRDDLMAEHRWLALHCARRFTRRGEPLDDLMQVAQLGLLKALDRYDPGFGTAFTTFAMPTVLGELRRHFRDHTWPLRVPRRVKERYLELSAAIELLGHDLGRPPSIQEIAEDMGTTVDEVLEAIEAGSAYRTATLVPPNPDGESDGDGPEGVTLGAVDAHLASAETRLSIHDLLARLPARERRMLYLRFYAGRTQSEIAADVGVSQVHVSRIIRRTLRDMKAHLASTA